MSIVVLKKKTQNRYSNASKLSGKSPGGYWLPQGPFGKNKTINSVMLENARHMGPVGFSINGGNRSISVGKEMINSKHGTPFRGIYPRSSGGPSSRYNESSPLLNTCSTLIRGNQHKYIKPSVVSTKGMLGKKYKWIHNGQYPNHWLQPIYTGNQTDTSSQGLYIQTKSSKNDCIVDTNDTNKYEDNIKSCVSSKSTRCSSRLNRNLYPYTKTLYIPRTGEQYTLSKSQKCVNPDDSQKPYPYRVKTGAGILSGGINVGSGGCVVQNT
jgi:hypothetical protein